LTTGQTKRMEGQPAEGEQRGEKAKENDPVKSKSAKKTLRKTGVLHSKGKGENGGKKLENISKSKTEAPK